ncbi:MAG: radical SAM protein [Rikenellaceae bacterium]|nr:radical SAM protein [Rikenellaceae bacterium]
MATKPNKIGLRKRLALNLYSGIRSDLEKEHPLREIFWECTLRCNLNCVHCGSDCRSSSATPDMPAEDFLRAIDQVTPHVDPHLVMIVITGGEALCRKDLESVGRELYKRGYPWGLVTNGMLLTRERMRSLVAAGMRSITLSIDGFEEQHNAIRRHPQSWRNAERALEVMTTTEGIVYDVVTCVGPHNIDSMPAFRQWLIDKGCKAWRLFTIFPVGRAAENDALQLSPEQYRSLMEFIIETRKQGQIKCNYACEGFLGDYESEVRDNFFGCMAGVSIAGVKIDGSISGCTSIRAGFDQGNIYKDNLWEVWQNGFGEFRDRSWARKGECANCKVWKFCKGNGMHLYDDDHNLLHCNYNKLCR